MSDTKPAPIQLAPLTDAQRFEIYREALVRYVTLKPTHAPREKRGADSKLSPTYRAAAWAMDTLKSAEEIWRREQEWRANPQASSAQTGGGNDTPF